MNPTPEKTITPNRKHNIIPLFTLLLAVILSGFLLSTGTTLYFMKLEAALQQRTQNQKVRLTISELIVNDLKEVEGEFFRLATIAHPDNQELCRENIHSKLDEIMNLLSLIEKGGSVERHTPINLPQSNNLITTLTYIAPQLHNLEIIQLRPELIRITEKIEQLAPCSNSATSTPLPTIKVSALRPLSRSKNFSRSLHPSLAAAETTPTSCSKTAPGG